VFSIGCLIYYLVSLTKKKKPHLLNMFETTSKQSHLTECNQLIGKLSGLLTEFDPNLQQIIRQMVSENPQMRGNLGQQV